MPSEIYKKCFVCQQKVDEHPLINAVTNLPVCKDCAGTEKEKNAEQDAMDGMASGFVCGCI